MLFRWTIRTALLSFVLLPLKLSASCVTLSWTATGDDGYVGEARQYDVRYSTQYLTDDNWATATQARCPFLPKPSGQRETLVVGSLEPGQAYYFALKVADEKFNWSKMSNVVMKVSPPDPCNGTVGNANCDSADEVTIADISMIISFMFGDGFLCCDTEADVDKNGTITIGDISRLIDHLFITLAPLPSCN